METTFISIHDLSLDARLLYVSNSIVDILGYAPAEVIGKSCWEYFHPDEIPFAQAIHGRGVQLDKAAVLNYCKIRDKWGYWIGCECVFTIVHDVLVAATSIYRRGIKSQKRAENAPIIRQLFSSSPRDPRYHMLSYISSKFSTPSRTLPHEPRAALFLNRFTRTLTIMYATTGLTDLLGISSDELIGKSFYYCIQENCLQEAVKCLESAKANDSIAYLRFWFRDPRVDDAADRDETMSETHSSDDDDGGVHLESRMDTDSSDHHANSNHLYSGSRSSADGGAYSPENGLAMHDHVSVEPNSRSSSGNSTDLGENAADAIFDEPTTAQSSSSELSLGSARRSQTYPQNRRSSVPGRQLIELEAVVSCTSDGLVVVLRGARPFLPSSVRAPHHVLEPTFANGLFASPWATQPIIPDLEQTGGFASHTNGSFNPQQQFSPVQATSAISGTPQVDFMQSIREVAVFAWALTGINGSLAQYSRGTSSGESQPPAGMPVWDPHNNGGLELEREHSEFCPSGQIQTNNYYPQTDRRGVQAWDRSRPVRHWSGSQHNLLSVGLSNHSPRQYHVEDGTDSSSNWH